MSVLESRNNAEKLAVLLAPTNPHKKFAERRED
jgi:hypothetical protein